MDEITENDDTIQDVIMVDESNANRANTRKEGPLDFEQPDGKRTRANTSSVWKYFTKIGLEEDGKERAKCNSCGRKYVIGGNSGTSHLTRHRSKCHLLPRYNDVAKMIIGQNWKVSI